MTVPKCLHAVYNFGVSFATAQNFICEEVFGELKHQLDLVNSSPDTREDRELQHVFMETLYQHPITKRPAWIKENYRWLQKKLRFQTMTAKARFITPDIIQPVSHQLVEQ